MAVAKKVKGRSEDQSEDFRQNKQHSWLSPICIAQAQVEEKHIKGEAKVLSHGLSLPRACTLSLSLSLSLPCVCTLSLSLSHSLPPHALLHSLLFKSWILLLSYK